MQKYTKYKVQNTIYKFCILYTIKYKIFILFLIVMYMYLQQMYRIGGIFRGVKFSRIGQK